MIILNDKRFCDEMFIKVSTKKDIENTKNNSTLIFDYDEDKLELFQFCKINNIPYGVNINSVPEFIFISNLNAKYAFCENIELAKKLQKIADNYLVESKVILKSNIKQIENIALNEIDGIFVL